MEIVVLLFLEYSRTLTFRFSLYYYVAVDTGCVSTSYISELQIVVVILYLLINV